MVFTIVDGVANGNTGLPGPHNRLGNGGGIYSVNNTDVNLSNLIIANNFAIQGGGGIYQRSSNSNLNNIAFLNNVEADVSDIDGDSGGAIASVGSTGTVVNSLFVNNKANLGSAISTSGEQFDIVNSTFVGNEANNGTINASNIPVNIENSIFEL